MSSSIAPLDILSKGTETILPQHGLEKKLSAKKKLRVKLGVDPTAPDLHLGHAVVLRKLREFQDLGHEVIFLIGDFTARIGDPSGKSKTRPVLGSEDITHNMNTYFTQVKRILDEDKTVIAYNSQWLSSLNLQELLGLLGKVTLARVIERDDFQKRYSNNEAIGMHELLYPLMQGYDSVALEADIEIGGTDQTFNLLMGRHLQEAYGQEPQVILTMPLLEGLDGEQKMSKSLNNYIGLFEQPRDAYGKLMSISDTLMWRYYTVLLLYSPQDIMCMQKEVASQKMHPLTLKKKMAWQIVSQFWSSEQATQAQQQFESVFQKQDYSQAKEVSLPKDISPSLWIVDLLKSLGAIETSSQARRLIQDGAVKIDDIKITDFKQVVDWKPDMVIKVGKHRIYRIA